MTHRKATHCGLALVSAMTLLLTACSITGPTAIRNGRLLYNEAITETNSQQILLAIVQNRYLEETNLLAVSSVTANVQIQANAQVQLGFGDNDTYDGNLVPFSAGTTYEENPTISYVPVAGGRYLRQIAAPTPISVLAQLSGVVDPAPVYRTLIASLNGIRNPDFLYPAEQPDPRFERAIGLMSQLIQRHRLHWVGAPGQSEVVSLVIARDDPTARHDIDELLVLLGLPPAEHPEIIEVPVSLAFHGEREGGIGITTRSVFRLVELLSAAVEIPDADAGRGVASDYPPPGPAGSGLHVLYSSSKPSDASASVPYRNGWFYIDSTDQTTKRFFRILVALWSAAMSDASSHVAAPLLTVPVSR